MCHAPASVQVEHVAVGVAPEHGSGGCHRGTVRLALVVSIVEDALDGSGVRYPKGRG